jgi:transposase
MFLNLPSSTKIHLATEPVNLCLSFDGLSLLARFVVQEDPLTGHLFVFFNRARTMTKILWWDGGAFCLFAKRLETGRFQLPRTSPETKSVSMDPAQLALILDGIDLQGARRRPRWAPLFDVDAEDDAA